MRRILLVAALCLPSAQALAEWRLSDLSDEMSKAYAGVVADAKGNELEVYCDDWPPGLVDLAIYTVEAATDTAKTVPVRVMVTVDAAQSQELDMFIDGRDGQVTLYTSNLDADNFEDVLMMIAQGAHEVELSGPDWSYVFPTAGAAKVMRDLADICPT